MTLVKLSRLAIQTSAGDAIVSRVDMEIGHGEIVGVIGESGSGKSMTLKAIAGLLPTGVVARGEIGYEGTDLLRQSRAEYRRFRDREIGIVYQDPRAHVNPVHTVGDFLTEALRVNRKFSRGAARTRAIELCREVGIPDPEHLLDSYPYQFSGGMLQRAVIAAALATEPRLILADEPTTALDVTRQAEVAALLRGQVRERGIGMMFITHDLELAAALCDRVYVMYRGRVVDTFAAERLAEATHPYTRALLAARPSMEHGRGVRLETIGDELRAQIDTEVGL